MEGASLGLSEKVIEKLFQEAANDKNVIESRKWVEVNYPSDDLDTYRPSDVITSVYLEFRQIGCNQHFIIHSIDAVSDLCQPSKGRFQVTKMRSMRRDPVRNIENIVKEEVRNVRQVFERRLSQEEGADTGKKTTNVFNIDKKSLFGADHRGLKKNSRLEFVHIV